MDIKTWVSSYFTLAKFCLVSPCRCFLYDVGLQQLEAVFAPFWFPDKSEWLRFKLETCAVCKSKRSVHWLI